MTSVQAGVRQKADLERGVAPAPKPKVAPADSVAELDAEARANQALAVQQDWKPDLSGVALHDDAVSRASADSIGAAAYTRGSDVYLGSAYRAGTPQGDHVLAHELAHVEQGNTGDAVHRFPATALTAGPVDWSGSAARKLGGGVSGGVFEVTSANQQDELKQVMVKPVFGKSGLGTDETGDQLQFGDRALSQLMGIKTPTSRVVNAGTPEYQQIVSLLDPLSVQPQITEGMSDEEKEAAHTWQPISAAKSFVIMGQVPGSSVASLADKAATDDEAAAKLQRAILDPAFIADVARLCVGDMLLGNNDRMIMGAMNLGNLMVESQESGENTLWAIDTNAVLGKDFLVDDMVSSGSVSRNLQGIGNNLKKSTSDRPKILQGFLDIAVGRVKAGIAKRPPTKGPNIADVLEQQIKDKHANLLDAFIAGWDDALGSIYSLVNSEEGKQKMGALTKDYEGKEGEKQLNSDVLGWQARMLTTAQSGESEASVAGDAAATLLRDADTSRLQLPLDEHSYDMIDGPASGALQTDYEKPASLPRSTAISANTLRKGGTFQPQLLPALRDGVWASRAEVAQEAGGETKSRGVIKKKEVTRNRVLANNFVSSNYLVVPGAYRALGVLKDVELLSKQAMAAAGTKDPGLARAAADKVRDAIAAKDGVSTTLASYGQSLATAAKGVGRMRATGKDNKTYLQNLKGVVAEAADKATSIGNAITRDIDGRDLPSLLATLQQTVGTPKPKPAQQQGPTGPAQGAGARRPLIGPRGKK